MPVAILDQTGQEPEFIRFAERAAEAILACVGREKNELSVLFVGDDHMRGLNREWRGKDSTTDVLSFSQLEGSAAPKPGAMLGDVVVSVDRLRSQAAVGGWSADQELVRLVLHGVLHLLGFDHENEDDARVMGAEECRIVRELEAQGISCAWEEEAGT